MKKPRKISPQMAGLSQPDRRSERPRSESAPSRRWLHRLEMHRWATAKLVSAEVSGKIQQAATRARIAASS